MESDDLVAEDVGPGCDGGRDDNGPGVVVCDQLVGGPGTGGSGVVYQTGLVDFKEREGGLVDC